MNSLNDINYLSLEKGQKSIYSKFVNKGFDKDIIYRMIIKDKFDYDEIDELPEKSHCIISFECSICKIKVNVTKQSITRRKKETRYKKICISCAQSISQKLAYDDEENMLNHRIGQLSRFNSTDKNKKYDLLFYNRNYKDFLNSFKNNCYSCNKELKNSKTDLHHIMHDKQGNKDSSIKNIAFLCKGCHTTVHHYERGRNPLFHYENEKMKAKALELYEKLKKDNIKFDNRKMYGSYR